jgi:hypothetical protein
MKAMVSSTHSSLLRALREVIGKESASASASASSTDDDRQLPIIVIEALNSEPWVSATFSGHRHWLELRLHGCASGFQMFRDRLATRLGEAEVDLPGHILADIALVESAIAIEQGGEPICRMTLEALTIED